MSQFFTLPETPLNSDHQQSGFVSHINSRSTLCTVTSKAWNKLAAIELNNTSVGTKIWGYTPVDGISDNIEIAVSFGLTSDFGKQGIASLRYSGTSEATTKGYTLSGTVIGGVGTLAIDEGSMGYVVWTPWNYLPANNAGGNLYSARFRIDGNRLRAKVWTMGGTEPDWMLDTTNDVTSTGNFNGLHTYASGNVDYFSVGFGTNGDPAPLNAIVQNSVITTGNAAILKSLSLPQTGNARISHTNHLDVSGNARIAKNISAQQTGNARVRAAENITQSGISRVRAQRQASQTGRANIRSNVNITQTGSAVISIPTRTARNVYGFGFGAPVGFGAVFMPGSLRTQFDQMGNARIVNTYQKQISGNARIRLTKKTQQTGNSRIERIAQAYQQGNSRIQAVSRLDISGNARIIVTETLPISGNSRIERTNTIQQTGNARVLGKNAINQYGNARILNSGKLSQSGNARIKYIVPDQLPSDWTTDEIEQSDWIDDHDGIQKTESKWNGEDEDPNVWSHIYYDV